MRAVDVYTQFDGAVTKRYYSQLEQRGIAGIVALNLFRAQKTSARAKVYTKPSYRTESYARKEWSMSNLCEVLGKHGDKLMLRYGWKEDPSVVFGQENSFVLYVDLPNGQVSFHFPHRGNGPDYPGVWDRSKSNVERVIAFCDMVFNREWPTHAEAFAE